MGGGPSGAGVGRRGTSVPAVLRALCVLCAPCVKPRRAHRQRRGEGGRHNAEGTENAEGAEGKWAGGPSGAGVGRRGAGDAVPVENVDVLHRFPPDHRAPEAQLGVAQREVEQLARGLIAGEVPPHLERLAHRAMQALDRIGRVEQPPHRQRIGQHRAEPLPVPLPERRDLGKALAPKHSPRSAPAPAGRPLRSAPGKWPGAPWPPPSAPSSPPRANSAAPGAPRTDGSPSGGRPRESLRESRVSPSIIAIRMSSTPRPAAPPGPAARRPPPRSARSRSPALPSPRSA